MVKKTDMVKAVAAKASITQVQAEAFVDAFLGEFTEQLAKGEKVQFMGIGSFEVKNRAARVSRNPRTGESVEVASSNYVSFSAGKKLKDAVQAAKVEPAKKVVKKTVKAAAKKTVEAKTEESAAEEKKPAKRKCAPRKKKEETKE